MNQRASMPLEALESGAQLPFRFRTITQEQLNQYARVSGDQNPLHLDQDFAATTQFGGIIAHGMLTMALISEMLVAAFGQSWLETGSLKVRFKGAAYVGDHLETRGKVEKVSSNGRFTDLVCAVGVWNRGREQEIITGTARLTLS